LAIAWRQARRRKLGNRVEEMGFNRNTCTLGGGAELCHKLVEERDKQEKNIDQRGANIRRGGRQVSQENSYVLFATFRGRIGKRTSTEKSDSTSQPKEEEEPQLESRKRCAAMQKEEVRR